MITFIALGVSGLLRALVNDPPLPQSAACNGEWESRRKEEPCPTGKLFLNMSVCSNGEAKALTDLISVTSATGSGCVRTIDDLETHVTNQNVIERLLNS
jgi:hypothetical protein